MAKKLAVIFGIVFILVGVLAFVPNPIVGPNTDALFATDRIHDMIHLLSGIVLLVVGLKKPENAATALKVFGAVYLLVTVLGFIATNEEGKVLGLITMNQADHFLHLVLGIVLIAAGTIAASKDRMVSSM